MENTKVRFGEWISEAWNMLTAKWQTWLAITIIYMIPIGVIYVMMINFSLNTLPPFTDLNDLFQIMNDHTLHLFVLQLIMIFLITFVKAFFLGGIFKTAFKQLNGEEITPSDIFNGTEFYLNVLVASLIISLFEFFGSFLYYIPALITNGLFFLTIPLIVRKDLPPLEALKESINVTKNNWIMFSLFAFFVELLAALGIFACCVGIIFTLPLLFLTAAVAYRDCYEPELKPMSRVDQLYSKYCRSCGAAIPVHAAVCDKCGASQV